MDFVVRFLLSCIGLKGESSQEKDSEERCFPHGMTPEMRAGGAVSFFLARKRHAFFSDMAQTALQNGKNEEEIRESMAHKRSCERRRTKGREWNVTLR
jgi:hypothetical protein